MCGWPSSTVTSGAARSAGNSSSRIRVAAARPGPGRACSERNTRSGEVRHTTSAGCPAAVELVGGGEHLGHDRAHADQRHRRRAARGARAAGSRPPAPARAASRASRVRRARAPAPGRSAGWSAGSTPTCRRAGRAAERVQAAPTPGPGRTRAPRPRSRGCSRPIDGVMIDWCAPPSGARVTPDGVPTRIDCPPA